MSSHCVNANPAILPTGWSDDPYQWEEVCLEVRRLLARGISGLEVARLTGVSSRGVGRIKNYIDPHICSASRYGEKREGFCDAKVTDGQENCRWHR